jgi:hypothetical protein
MTAVFIFFDKLLKGIVSDMQAGTIHAQSHHNVSWQGKSQKVILSHLHHKSMITTLSA